MIGWALARILAPQLFNKKPSHWTSNQFHGSPPNVLALYAARARPRDRASRPRVRRVSQRSGAPPDSFAAHLNDGGRHEVVNVARRDLRTGGCEASRATGGGRQYGRGRRQDVSAHPSSACNTASCTVRNGTLTARPRRSSTRVSSHAKCNA
eukprot:1751056-Pleurochrysis_carterae.AAC.1